MSVACGVLANVGSPVGREWLERIEARYLAVAPTPGTGQPSLPFSAPWFLLGTTTLALLLASAFLAALADARDPLPAT